MILAFYIFAFLFFLLTGFLFAGSEMALISLNRYRISKKAETGDPKARALQRILDDPVRMINTLLIGINLSIIAGSIFVHAFFDKVMENNPALWALLASSFIYLLAGELLPKTLFHHAPNKMALKIVPFLKISFYLFRPVEKYFSALVRKTIRKNPDLKKKRLSKDEFLDLLELASAERTVNEMEKNLILKTFRLKFLKVKDIMIPIERVDGIPSDAALEEAVRTSRKSRHSRIIVYDPKDRASVTGILTVYDILFSKGEAESLASLVRPAVFVTENMSCDRALRKLRSHRNPFLVVRGPVSGKKSIGIVTASDLINHLFGEKIV